MQIWNKSYNLFETKNNQQNLRQHVQNCDFFYRTTWFVHRMCCMKRYLIWKHIFKYTKVGKYLIEYSVTIPDARSVTSDRKLALNVEFVLADKRGKQLPLISRRANQNLNFSNLIKPRLMQNLFLRIR